MQDIQGIIQNLNSFGFGSVLIFLVIGVLLTILVQSSSAAMGITIIVAINGWIDFEIAAAIVMGENIGTTVTAWLASITPTSTPKERREPISFSISRESVGCWCSFIPSLQCLIRSCQVNLYQGRESTRSNGLSCR